MMVLKFEWLDHGRTVMHPPNPHYPDGIDMVVPPSRHHSFSLTR